MIKDEIMFIIEDYRSDDESRSPICTLERKSQFFLNPNFETYSIKRGLLNWFQKHEIEHIYLTLRMECKI